MSSTAIPFANLNPRKNQPKLHLQIPGHHACLQNKVRVKH